MYDPYRHEYADGVIGMHNESRKSRYEYLKLMRRETSEFLKLMSIKSRNHIIRSSAPKAMMKPTVENLRTLAKNMWQDVELGIPPGLPCGADDAYGEGLDYKRSYCLAIWRAVGRF